MKFNVTHCIYQYRRNHNPSMVILGLIQAAEMTEMTEANNKKEEKNELYVVSAPQILQVTLYSMKAEQETTQRGNEADHRHGKPLPRVIHFSSENR